MFQERSQCFPVKSIPTREQVHWSCQNALKPCLASNPQLTRPEEILIIQRPTEPGILGSSVCMGFSNSQISIRGGPTFVFL